MAETLTTPPPVAGPQAPSRSQEIDSIIKDLPAEQQADVRSKFGQTLRHSDLETYVRALPLDPDSKSKLWDAYWKVEAPKPRPVPLQPQEPSLWEGFKKAAGEDFRSALADYRKQKAAENLPQPPKPPQVPALPQPPNLGATNVQTVTPNTPVTTQDLTKPELRLPAPGPAPKPVTIAGTFGNALVMSDGTQATQNPRNMQIYHDSGYPELTQADLLKLQQGKPLTPQGLAEPGTIKNLYNRPVYMNPDGRPSTTRSMSFDEDGKEVVVPTVVDGKLLSNKEAIDRYKQTGEHLGKFNNVPDAEAFAQNLHESQAQRMGLPVETATAPFRALTPTGEQETPEQLLARTGRKFSATGPPAQPQEAGVLDTLKNLPGNLRVPGLTGEPVKPVDAYGNLVTMSGGLLRGISLGYYDPEKGTFQTPVTGTKYQLRNRTLSDILENDWGVSSDVAKDGNANTLGAFVGTVVPWSAISKTLSAAVGLAQSATTQALVETGAPQKAVDTAVSYAKDILKHAGIQAATGATYAALEKPPDDETAPDKLKRVGETALYAAGFSALVDGLGHLLHAIPGHAGIPEEARETVDKVRDDIYDLFYRSGRFSSEEAAKAAADRVMKNAPDVGELAKLREAAKRRFEQEAPEAQKGPEPVPGPPTPEAAQPGPAPKPPETKPAETPAPEVAKTPEAPPQYGSTEPGAGVTTSIHPDAIPENKNLPKGMEAPDGDMNHGSSSVGLEGKKEAQQLAASKDLPKKIYASDLPRAMETAQAIQQAHPDTQVIAEPGLQPWALGGLEGQKMADVLPKINALATDLPDAVPSGRGPISTRDGQSFHQWEDQLGSTIQKIMDEFEANPTEDVGVLSHSRDFQWLHAWLEKGMPADFRIDGSKLLRAYADTGGREYLYKDKDGWVLDDKKPPEGVHSIQLIRHAQERQANVPSTTPVAGPPAEAPKPPELETPKPKKEFKIADQKVAGTYQGKVVTENGVVHDRHPNYLKTLKAFGYPELSDEQFKALGGQMPVEAPPSKGKPVIASKGETSMEVAIHGTTANAAEVVDIAKQHIKSVLGDEADNWKPSGTTAAIVPTRSGVKVRDVRVQFERAETAKAQEPVPAPPVEPEVVSDKDFRDSIDAQIKQAEQEAAVVLSAKTNDIGAQAGIQALRSMYLGESQNDEDKAAYLKVLQDIASERPPVPGPKSIGPAPEQKPVPAPENAPQEGYKFKTGDKVTFLATGGKEELTGTISGLSHAGSYTVSYKRGGKSYTTTQTDAQLNPLPSPKNRDMDARLANYFRPGRVIKGDEYWGPDAFTDTVKEFKPSDQKTGGWNVTVSRNDKGDVRTVSHATQPSVRELWNWEHNNPVGSAPTAETPKAEPGPPPPPPKMEPEPEPEPKAEEPKAEEPKAEEPKQEPKDKGPFGSKNKYFTEDKANSARERLRSKFNQLNAGFDPEMLSDMFQLGAYYFEGGVREFGAWAEKMVGDIGEGLRPYLQSQFDLISQWFKDHPEALDGGSDVNEPKPAAGVGNVEGAGSESVGRAGGGSDAAGARGEGGPSEPGVGSGQGAAAAQPAKPGTPRGTQPQRAKQPAGERFSLVGKPPIDLTPAQRREINAQAERIADSKNPGDPLTPEEQNILRQYTGQGGLGTADEGVLFQHYTSYKVVQWQWDKIAAMGYPLDGASMLEPAAGVGNYMGFAPPGMRMTAVEIDPTAAKIAKLLYPQADVQNKPFENFISRQKFDIVISNVPFSPSRGELRYAKDAHEYKDIETLHDFFFVKGLDLAKPNGIVSFLTSTGTMDKAGDEIRKLINEKAEFLGAYRTPAGEFKKNTQYGGSVDAIILRKRTPEEIEAFKALNAGKITADDIEKMGFTRPIGYDKDWVESTTTDKFSKPDQPPARLSKYYIENPKQMWGQPEAGYGVRQVTRMGVRPTEPIEKFIETSLGDHIQWKPEATVAAPLAELETETPVGKAPEGKRHGTLVLTKSKELAYVHSDGNLYPAFPKGMEKKTEARVLAGVQMMDMAERMFDALRQNDNAKADKIRPQLRTAITNYRTQFGDKKGGKLGKPPGYDPYLWKFLNGGTESMILSFEDPRRWLLAGLTDDEGKFSTIFNENTIYRKPIEVRKYNDQDLADVAKFVYEQTGEFQASRPEIEAKYNGKPVDLDTALIGQPGFSISSLSADGKPTIDIDDEYMYGSIWPKIDQTESMIKQVQQEPPKDEIKILEQLHKQLDALQAALPAQATLETMPVDPFGSYMDPATIIHWLKSFGMNGQQVYVPENNRNMWEIGGSGRLKMKIVINDKTGEIGDHEFEAKDLEGFLNHKRITKKVDTGETDYRGRPKYKEVFDLAEQRKNDQIGDHFKDWFRKNPRLVEHLVPTYNRMYRSYRHRTPSSQEMNVEGLSGTFKGKPLKLGSHQWEVVNQLLHNRSGINAHGVGSGKTMAGILLGRLAKQRGLLRKPMYVVPAKVVKNWGFEITQMFPNAYILDTSGMNAKNRNKTLNRVAASDADFVLSTYEGMKEIPLRAAEDYIQEDLRELSERLHEVHQKGDKKTETMIQDQIRKYSEKLARIQDMKKTNAIFFEDLGVDSIVVDEGHNYKNAPVQYMDMSEWLHATSFSDRAADMGYKTRYIHESKGGRAGQNVWMLTATPTPNNPIEIYSMMKYIAPDEWRQRGIINAGDFVEQFGIVGQVEEPGTTGVPKIRTVFLGYKNLNDLRSIFRRYIDMRPTRMFALKRPEAAYIDHNIEPTPEVIFEAARVAELDAWVSQNYAEAAANGWIPLSVLTLARKLAADLAIYNPIKYAKTLGREGSKLRAIVDLVKSAEQGDNTQLIFVDIYRATANVIEGSKQEQALKKFLENLGGGAAGMADLQGVSVDDDSTALVTDGEAAGDKKTTAPDTGDAETGDKKAKIKTYEIVNIHKAIQKALIDAGIPEDQIAIINQATNNSAAKKFKLQQLNAEGKVRFLIGTTSSMGEGMNLQANTTDIHHYDVPWTPAALEQREGRGVRQGNKQAELGNAVRIHRYVGKGTSDAKMYAILARKAQWNEDMWFGDADQVMDFDQDHRNYADISAGAQIEASVLEYWQVSRRLVTNAAKLKELQTENLAEDQRMLKQVQDEQVARQAKIEQYEADIRAGRGNADYMARLIEQHRAAIENLKQEEQTRADTVGKAEKAIADLRTTMENDRKKLTELIPVMKEKGMPVLPEHEAMAAGESAEPDESRMQAVPGPDEISLKPVPGPAGQPKPTAPVNIPTRSGGEIKLHGWPIAPGLAVTPDVDKEGHYSITHTLSGLRVTGADTLERAIALGNRLAKLGDWNRSADALQSDPAIIAGVRRELGQKGALNFWKKKAPPSIQPSLIPSPDPEMQKLVRLPDQHRDVWKEVQAIPGQVYRFLTTARYNENLKEWPAFAEEVRRAQEMAYDAAGETRKQMANVVKGLDRPGYDTFRSIVFWEDMYETAAREGEDRVPLPGQHQLARIDAEIQRLNSIATPAVLDAVDRFHGWMDDIWTELARRGKVDPDEGRIKYFPNQIIRGIGDAIDRLPGLPTRMQNPRRLYLRNRKGHTAPHDADWIRVMEQYGTRVYLHNMIDDFIDSTAEHNNFLQWLDQPQLQQLGGGKAFKVGRAYVLETSSLTPKQRDEILTATRGGPGYTGDLPDKIVLKAFQFNPGNVIYPVRAINDEIIWDAVNSGMSELTADIDAFRNAALSSPRPPQLETTSGEELTRPALALGGKHTIYLLPAPIADKLEHFRENNLENPFTELVRAATRAWKGAVINTSGLTYYVHITVGNQIAAYAEDLGALMKEPAALAALRKKMPDPQYQQLMQLAEDFRIWNSVFYAGGMPRAVNAPEFRDFRQPNWRDNPFGDAIREYQRYGQIVQTFPKLAKLMADLERISNGQAPVVKGVGLGGLDPKSMHALGKIAREAIHPDYGAVSPRMDLFYSVTFPFSVFHVKIIGPWLRRMVRTGKFFPGDEFLLKIVLGLFVSAFLWNHLLYPEVEEKLADWQKNMRHLNTPFHDEKGRPVILAMETPPDIVARWGGLHTLESNLDRVGKGQWTWEDAAKQQLQDMFGNQPHGGPVPTAPAAVLYEMYNPMLKVLVDLHANKDSFTGQDIVSKSEPNLWGDPSKDTPQTETGKRLQREYVAKKLIAPYMQILRATQMDTPDAPVWNWLTSNGPFAWKRALGIRSVDPNGPDVKDWYADRNWNESLYDEKMLKVADAYVLWESGQISNDQRDAMVLPLLDQPGPNPTFQPSGAEQSDIQRMREKPQYQIRVVEGMLRRTTDPEERKSLLQELDALEFQIHRNSYKSTPARIRPYIGQPPVPAPTP